MSHSDKSDSEMREKVWNMVKDVRVATLVTKSAGGQLCARPMHAQKMEKYDEALWFFTGDATSKVQEIRANDDVLLVYSDPDDQNYVNINGTAEVLHDRAKIKELWSEPMRVWFPDGPEDANIALIRVVPEAAEYWDAPSSAFLHAYGYVKQAITGQAPKGGENERVRM